MTNPPFDPAIMQEVLIHRLGKLAIEEATQTAIALTAQRECERLRAALKPEEEE